MNIWKLWKKIWIPVVTVVIICLSGLILTGAMKTSEAMQSGQIVLSSGNTGAPAATSVPSKTEATVPSTSGYHFIDVLDEESPSPGEKDLDYQQAGLKAANYLETIFGTDLKTSSIAIYMHYQKYEGMVNGQYYVSVGSVNGVLADFTCLMDSVSGELCYAEKHTSDSQQKNGEAVSINSQPTEIETDPKLKEVARKLVNEKFADGRTLVEMYIDGVQTAYQNPANGTLVDCKVHMSEGACYTVQIAYPSYSVVGFSVFPLGWHSCIWGYWNPIEASENPSLEETLKGVDAVIARQNGK